MSKKTLVKLVTAILFFSVITTKVQGQTAYDKGTLVVTAGIGIPDFERLGLRIYYGPISSTYSNGTSSSKVAGVGPFMLKGDYGIYKFKWGHAVGAGIVIGFSPTTVKSTVTDWVNTPNGGYYGTYTEKDIYNRLTIGARGTYHFFIKEKIDCYASVGLGFNINMYSHSTNDPNGTYLYAPYGTRSVYEAFTVGVRYYFTKNIGVYAEGGYDNLCLLHGGLALKF